jgi:hypothetical protein
VSIPLLTPRQKEHGIRLTLYSPRQKRLELLGLLLGQGWTPGYNGKQIMYLPPGDKNRFHWKFAAVSEWPQVLATLEQVQGNGERIGLDLSWQGSERGGLFHFDGKPEPHTTELWTAWFDDRPLLADCGWLTDQNWYLQRIVPVLVTAGVYVQEVRGVDRAGG